jgi:arabinofuranosyltransferase
MTWKGFYIATLFLALLLFTYTYIANAWVVDDAYITFRTVDNFVNGYGLRWNIAERVQVYTHPMWMLLISIIYYLTSDVFYTSLAVSYVLCVVLLLVAARSLAPDAPWKPLLFIALLIGSKTVMDYTSSGLETPLSYLLAGLFYFKFLVGPKCVADFSSADVFYLLLLASLSFFNRYDTVLLYAPALAYLGWVHAPRLGRRFVGLLAAASVPAVSWVGFALLYYGSPWPNTAYAKMITSAVPLTERASRGWQYFTESVAWDGASYIVLLLAILLTVGAKRRDAVLALGGVVLYFGYTVTTAAAATHLGGRFLAVPLLIGFIVFAKLVTTRAVGGVVAAVVVVYAVWSSVSPVKMGTRFYQPHPQDPNRIDANWYVHQEGAALLDLMKGEPLPDHKWFHDGERFRDEPVRVHVGGAFDGPAVGYFGFAAGPAKHIIDWCALGDPLLARLPACRAVPWKSGHFRRAIPEGYLESISTGQNAIAEPSLREYYDKLRKITRGRIFDRGRLWDVLKMNCGCYQHLLDADATLPRGSVGQGPRQPERRFDRGRVSWAGPGARVRDNRGQHRLARPGTGFARRPGDGAAAGD